MANKYAPIIEKFQTSYTDKSYYDMYSPVPRQEVPKLSLGPKLDEAHLDKVEAQLGYPLPEDYREFLRDYAGIYLSPVAIITNDNSVLGGESIWGFENSTQTRNLADSYFQILEGCTEACGNPGGDVFPGIHLIRDVPHPVEVLGWPEELLPIGWDQGGNEFGLALFGLRPGAIFKFNFTDDIYLIANSFDEFMHLLQPAPQ